MADLGFYRNYDNNGQPIKKRISKLNKLWTRLYRLHLKSTKLVSSYKVFLKLEDILNQMADLNEDVECLKLRKMFEVRVPLWMLIKTNAFVEGTPLAVIRQTIESNYQLLIQSHKSKVVRKQFAKNINAYKRKINEAGKMSEIEMTPFEASQHVESPQSNLTLPDDDAVSSDVEEIELVFVPKVVTKTFYQPPMVVLNKPITGPISAQNQTMECVFCNNRHNSDTCYNVVDWNKRLYYVSTKNLCVICFEKHSCKVQCAVHVQCCYCFSGDHHRSLCKRNPRIEQNTVGTSLIDLPRNNLCVFCSLHEYSEKCPEVRNLQDRRDFFKKLGRCLRCLFTHSAETWCILKTCVYCDGYHTAILCSKNPYIDPPSVDDTETELCDLMQKSTFSMPTPSAMRNRVASCIFCGSHPSVIECHKMKILNRRDHYCTVNKICRMCLGSARGLHKCSAINQICTYCDVPGHHPYLCSDNPHVKRVSVRGPPIDLDADESDNETCATDYVL